jgi:hypothetical protein
MSKRDAVRSKPNAARIETVRPAAQPSLAGAAARPKVSAPPEARRTVSEEDIRLRAYLKWEAAGRPEGDDLSFWLEAEQELRRA